MLSKFDQFNIYNYKEAVVHKNQSWSYAELSNVVERFSIIISRAVMKKERSCPAVVPLIGERSAGYIAAVLACWKLGIGVAPIASDTPLKRLKTIVDELQSDWILDCSGKKNPDWCNDSGINTLVLDFDVEHQNNTDVCVDSDSVKIEDDREQAIAYIIFTSGTTGKPKGVVIGFDSLEPVLDVFCEHYYIDQESRVTFTANIAFDAAMLEWLPAIMQGGTVCIVDKETLLDRDALLKLYEAEKISYSWLPTPVAETLMADTGVVLPSSLKILLTAGQRLTVRPPASWSTRVENAYGPSETTVIVSSSVVSAEGKGLPDIGRPLPGMSCYLVDENGREVPDGEAGELLVAGIGVGKGYYRQAELTEKSFFQFTDQAQKTIAVYATGDICRVNESGCLEFIGRKDTQIKIHGYRIEVSEILTCLASIQGIKQQHVLAVETPSGNMLVAYVTLQPDSVIDEEAIRQYLSERLPSYMVPSGIVILETFPLTANQKIDESRLPDPMLEQQRAAKIEPVSDEQKKFLSLFRKHLAVIHWCSDFFHSGGNSIAAISICADINKTFKRSLPFPLFEKHRTPEKLWQAFNQHEFQEEVIAAQIQYDEQGVFHAPLSSSQRSVWFLASLDNEDRAYHAKSRLTLRGNVSHEAVAYALQQVVNRNSIFRTSFVAGEGDGLQCVHEYYEVELARYDFTPLTEQEGADRSFTEVERLIDGELNRPFELSELPLVRWALVNISSDMSVLIHIEHHLVHDGWSYNLFLQEFLQAYNSYFEKDSLSGNNNTAQLPGQYADYCLAQARWMQTDAAQQHMVYWKKQLHNVPVKINLPAHVDKTDLPDKKAGTTLRLKLDRVQWNRVEQLAEQRGETPFSIMLSVYYLMLYRFSGDTDICVGSAFANRHWINADAIIGMMINTVVLRANPLREHAVDDFLAEVSRVVQQAHQYQALPFESLVNELNPQRVVDVNPLFQVFFGFHDSPMPDLTLNGIESAEVLEAIDSRAAKFDLSVIVIPRKGQIGDNDPVHLLWEFKNAAFPQWLVENMIDVFLDLLDHLLDLQPCPQGQQNTLPSQKISLGELIDASVDSNAVCGPEAVVTAVSPVEKFCQQAVQVPDNIALRCGDSVLTYKDLAKEVQNRIACLAPLNIRAGEFIGISLTRRPEAVAWMLACQAVGAGYVPIDPGFPQERIDYIVEHSRIQHIVTENPDQFQSALPAAVPDTQTSADLSDLLNIISADETPVYCIYTSGSTGLPKGVVISIRALNNLLDSVASCLQPQSTDTWLALTSFSFDISVVELLLPLTTGAQVVIATREDTRDIARLTALLDKDVTHCQGTPSTWRALTATGWRPRRALTVTSAGEAMDRQLAGALTEKGARCFNMYGPTETTIYSSIKAVDPQELSAITIGRPVNNTQFFLFNAFGEPVPHGAVGELWIAGDGLANGYLYNEPLTQERFVFHTLSETSLSETSLSETSLSETSLSETSSSERRMYRTGDLVSLDQRGELNYHGRADHQVKVSGYRIELEEIEQVIKKIDGVELTAVVVRESGDMAQLVAFIKGQCDENAIIQGCRKKLPVYMIPNRIVFLDEFPLTPSQKIDKNALPDVHEQPVVSKRPQTPTEQTLEKMLGRFLNLDQVDTDRHFTEQGGNSLMAMRVCASLEQAYGLRIKVLDLLQLGNITSIAAFIDSVSHTESAEVFAEEMTL